MKPAEFWDCEYREVYAFCQVNLVRNTEDFKREIIIQEAVSDKLIQADCMRERPKVVPLKKMFKDLFKKQ